MPKRRSGHTVSFIWFWISLVPLLILIQTLVPWFPESWGIRKLILPLAPVLQYSGMGSLAFLGLEYGSQVVKNVALPPGQGAVARLSLYKAMAYVWTGYFLLALGLSMYFTFDPPLPLNELATYSGLIMLAYVGGQKGSKLAGIFGQPSPGASSGSDSPGPSPETNQPN